MRCIKTLGRQNRSKFLHKKLLKKAKILQVQIKLRWNFELAFKELVTKNSPQKTITNHITNNHELAKGYNSPSQTD